MTSGEYPSTMRPLGSYVAKRCPRRVQLDIVQPVEQVPVADDVVMRMEAGIDHEASVVEQLRQMAGSDWVFADDDVAATTRAIDARAPLVVSSRLPSDVAEWRSGAPDLLVWHDDGYVPVDIKHHKTLDDGEGATISELAAPGPGAAEPAPFALRRNKDDALQLAHYRRMLEALGVAATSPTGGIIGKDMVVVWYDLAEPMWTTPAKSDGRKQKKRTTLEAYDFEFGIRRTWAGDAHRHLQDDTVDLLAPVRIGECGSCGWDAYCGVELEAGTGDASLLPGVGYRRWRLLREGGVESRGDVAKLDYETARLGKAGVDLAKWLGGCAGVAPETLVGEINPRARKQIATLLDAGMATAADVVAGIHTETAAFGGAGFLAESILDARAAVGPEPVYARPGVSDFHLPRADIELDVDMENVEDGVYLWGVWVTDHVGSGLVADGYVPFFTWEPLDDHTETELFAEFWVWLGSLSDRAAQAGILVRSYCWHESAEVTQLRRIARRDEALLGEVEAFVASGAWVDLEREFKRRWITGGSTGLKAIAPLSGFAWDVDDPGGGISMVRYVEALSGSDEARRWLLTYNEGDVLATKAIREWLASKAHWPVIAT